MFKYFYLIFVFWACIYKYKITIKVLKIEKIKGKINAGWITKLIFSFYILIFIIPIIETFLIDKKINYYLSISAFILYITGISIWLWPIKLLGKYWSTDIEIRDEQILIKKGPYKYMRHPHYLLLLLEVFCLPLIANAYYSLILLSIIYIPLITLRIIFEEKALIEKFGSEYLKYKKEVWGLFPIPVFKTGVKE